jgi:cation:H+ antiporter
MALLWNFLVVLFSAAVVILTADFAIRSSVAIAKRFRLSDELIGMTVLSIGTSMPEIITHIVGSIKILANPAELHDISGLVIGANIGSDIFQQNFLIGLIGIIGVIVVHKKHLIKDVGGLIAASVLLLLFSYNGLISRIEGLILMFLYIIYLVVLQKYGMMGRDSKIIGDKHDHVLKNSVIVIASFALMAFAANSLLKNSEILVRATPLSASFFGVILLGVASAFPEMTTSLIAVFKRKAKISAGILIGSNITNPMFAVGIGALISTYTVPNVSIVFDLPFKIATAFLIFFMLKKGHLKKWQAASLIGLYIAYLVIRNVYFPVDVFSI